MFLTVNTTQTIFTSYIVKTAALLYLHPRLCEPVQFLEIHIVSRGAVKQTGQHDQPHDSSCWFRPWTRTLLGSAQLGSALFCSVLLCSRTCSYLQMCVRWTGAEDRWCTAMSRPDLLPRQIFLPHEREGGVERQLIGYLRDPHQHSVNPIDLICKLRFTVTNV